MPCQLPEVRSPGCPRCSTEEVDAWRRARSRGLGTPTRLKPGTLAFWIPRPAAWDGQVVRSGGHAVGGLHNSLVECSEHEKWSLLAFGSAKSRAVRSYPAARAFTMSGAFTVPSPLARSYPFTAL